MVRLRGPGGISAHAVLSRDRDQSAEPLVHIRDIIVCVRLRMWETIVPKAERWKGEELYLTESQRSASPGFSLPDITPPPSAHLSLSTCLFLGRHLHSSTPRALIIRSPIAKIDTNCEGLCAAGVNRSAVNNFSLEKPPEESNKAHSSGSLLHDRYVA